MSADRGQAYFCEGMADEIMSEETRAAFLGQYSNIYLETIKLLLQIHRANPT